MNDVPAPPVNRSADGKSALPPRPRRHALTAFVLAAALLALLLLPLRPDPRNPVRLQFRAFTTNAGGRVEGVFAASNGWPRRVDMWRLSVEENTGSQWVHRFRHLPPSIALLAGEMAEVKVEVPNPESQWRAKVIWIVYSSRLTIWGWNLRAAAGRLFPAMAPDPVAWFHRHARTNHWPETAH